VLNLVFVRPHFGDRLKYQKRLNAAREKISKFETEIKEAKTFEAPLRELEKGGASVPEEDQATEFLRAIQSQAAVSGVSISGQSRQPARTNQFFMEQAQSVTVQSGEKELVSFLYTLGSGDSLIRVRDLSLRPDPPRNKLNANIRLVASYQKKTTTRPASGRAVPASKPATTKK
jgi:Tfp pilus assembly protein PilO